MISRLRLAGPTRAVRSGGSDVGGSEVGRVEPASGADVSAEGGDATKSAKEGPALRRSLKVVGRRGCFCSDASVAKARTFLARGIWGIMIEDEHRQRNLDTFEAIARELFQ